MLQLNKIYFGDNLDFLKQIDNNSIQLHFTSPPYAKMKVYENFEGIHPNEYVNWIMPRIKEIERTLKETGSFILNINDCVINKFRHSYVFDLISEIHKQTNLKLWERLFWNKGKFLPHPKRFGDKIEYLFWFVKNDNFYLNIDNMRVPYNNLSINRAKKLIKKRFVRTKENQDILEYKTWELNPLGALPSTLINIGSESQRKSDTHCAIFPIGLPLYFIKGSTQEQDTVCDVFSGIGTTCLAAKQLKRNYIGIDICKIYCDESEDRLKNLDVY